jgi:hypothetical protein
MPSRILNQQDDFNSIKDWLNNNLNLINTIIPSSNQLFNVPKVKGIYFWMIRKEGYIKLSNFIQLNRLVNVYDIEFKGIKYDLVYLGTSGTGKKGQSNLQERLEWHISQIHTPGSVCHGTLSTLRTGIGSVISDDLILPNTQILVNEIFKNYFQIFFIPYKDKFELSIDNDEKILIKVLKPLFNLKNNPNARINAQNNLTLSYKIRRGLVINSTRQRLGC